MGTKVSGTAAAGRESRRPLVIGAVGLLAAVVVVVVAIMLVRAEPNYELATPPTAGGLEIGPEGGRVMDPAELRATEAQVIVGGRAGRGLSAVYVDRANNGLQVTFTGVSGDLGDPSDLVARLQANPPQAVRQFRGTVSWAEVDPGPHGGKAACGTVEAQVSGRPLRIISCAWQTEHTFGQLTELPRSGEVQTLSATDMAQLMRRMRTDLESTG